MRLIISFLAISLLTSTFALACICDLQCSEGEVYSDSAEMCVAKDAPTS